MLFGISVNQCAAQDELPTDAYKINEVISSTGQFQQATPLDSLGWWTPHVGQVMREECSSLQVSIDQLIALAMQNSAQLQVYQEVPRIRQTAIQEAQAKFDWTRYLDAIWNDTSDPVGNSLTVGPDQDRLQEHNFNLNAGLRRTTKNGGTVETGQRLGHANSNSIFFTPNNQGTARFYLNFTQPLLRGRGEIYNNSLVVLANIDTSVARDEYERQLESHLLEVARAYWALYLQRGALLQKANLYVHTKNILDHLERREHIDAQKTQILSARAALAERHADMIRAKAGVENAETRLRGMINAPELGETQNIELLPSEWPRQSFMEFALQNSVETAVQYRSEVRQAIKQIKAGSVRLDMAKHEMMPVLNAVTEFYASGLRGNSNVGRAFIDQFSEGAPSYAIGIEYELPVGNRAATARRDRRVIELRQLQSQYRNALETVRNEVEVSVREIETAFREMHAKAVALQSAIRESASLKHRWEQLAGENGSGALTLQALLQAQERTTETEFDFLSAQLTYNLALVHIKRSMGILVTMDTRGNVVETAR